MRAVSVVAILVLAAACGRHVNTIPSPPPLTEEMVPRGGIRLEILSPKSGEIRYQHQVAVVVLGSPAQFQYSTYLLAIAENNSIQRTFAVPSQRRVYTFTFVPEPFPRAMVIHAELWTIKGFTIYGEPVHDKLLAEASQIIDAPLQAGLTMGEPGGTVDAKGELWLKPF